MNSTSKGFKQPDVANFFAKVIGYMPALESPTPLQYQAIDNFIKKCIAHKVFFTTTTNIPIDASRS